MLLHCCSVRQQDKTKLECFCLHQLQSPTLSITTDFFFLGPSLPSFQRNSGRTGKLKSLSDKKEKKAQVPTTSCSSPAKALYSSSHTDVLNRAGNETQIWMFQHSGSEKKEKKHPQQHFESLQSSWPRWSMCKFSNWGAASHHQALYRLTNNVTSASPVIAATSNKEICIACKPLLGLKPDHESDVPKCC